LSIDTVAPSAWQGCPKGGLDDQLGSRANAGCFIAWSHGSLVDPVFRVTVAPYRTAPHPGGNAGIAAQYARAICKFEAGWRIASFWAWGTFSASSSSLICKLSLVDARKTLRHCHHHTGRVDSLHGENVTGGCHGITGIAMLSRGGAALHFKSASACLRAATPWPPSIRASSSTRPVLSSNWISEIVRPSRSSLVTRK